MEKGTYKNITGSIGLITGLIILVLVCALIVGSLTSQSTFTDIAKTGTITNESGGFINSSGYTLDEADADDFSLSSILVLNATGDITITAGNYTVTAGVITNATAETWDSVLITYEYGYTDDTNVAGVDIGGLGTAFGAFVTALLSFLAVMGAIIAIVWLISYIKPLFDKKEGIQALSGS